MKKTTLICSTVFLLASCSANYKAPTEIDPIIKAPHNKSPLTLLNQAKKELLIAGYQIQTIDNDAGIISTELKNLSLTPAKANCGKTMGLDYLKDNRTKTQVAINVIVSKSDILIKTNIHGEYKPGSVSQDLTLTCISKGVIEQDLLNKIINM